MVIASNTFSPLMALTISETETTLEVIPSSILIVLLRQAIALA